VSTPQPHEPVKRVRNMRKMASPAAMMMEDRAAERRRLLTRGLALADTQSFATRRTTAVGASLAKTLIDVARKAGLSSPNILSFDIEAPKGLATRSKFLLAERISAPSAFHVAIGRLAKEGPVTRIVLVVAKEQRGEIVSVR